MTATFLLRFAIAALLSMIIASLIATRPASSAPIESQVIAVAAGVTEGWDR